MEKLETMEEFYYQKMTKLQQVAYHCMLKGVKDLTDEIQLPQMDGESLYQVFFQMRLDHPEIFWLTGYKYKYYKGSPNLIFVPEYLFDKDKIREHQKAMQARVEKLVRPAKVGQILKKKNMCMILSVKMYVMIS